MIRLELEKLIFVHALNGKTGGVEQEETDLQIQYRNIRKSTKSETKIDLNNPPSRRGTQKGTPTQSVTLDQSMSRTSHHQHFDLNRLLLGSPAIPIS